jgi:hypothetical protein
MSLRTEVDFGLDRLRPGEAICRPQRAAEIGGSASAFIAGNAGMVANNRRREAAATGRKPLDELNPSAAPTPTKDSATLRIRRRSRGMQVSAFR